MHIGRDGTSLRLDVVGYQFPEITAASAPGDVGNWDSNWLMIAGTVHTPDGQSWSFEDPSLTTGEARELVVWLRSVAGGEVRPMAAVAGPHLQGTDHYGHSDWLSFTERNIGFAVITLDGPLVELHVALGHEAAEPASDPDPIQPQCSHISIGTNGAQLQAAAAHLEAQLAAYPRR